MNTLNSENQDHQQDLYDARRQHIGGYDESIGEYTALDALGVEHFGATQLAADDRATQANAVIEAHIRKNPLEFAAEMAERNDELVRENTRLIRERNAEQASVVSMTQKRDSWYDDCKSLEAQLAAANTRIVELEAQVSTANRLLLFVERGDANTGYFGNDDWVVEKRKKQAAMREELEEYVAAIAAAPSAAQSERDRVTRDIEAGLADKPLEELLKMNLSDPGAIEAIASKPRRSNLQAALDR